jgi:hypothetical protein
VLEAQLLAEPFETATQLRLDVGAAELAAPGEEADIVGIAQPLCEQRVGQVEDALEIQVPCRLGRGACGISVKRRWRSMSADAG